jgi:hypothetical protein
MADRKGYLYLLRDPSLPKDVLKIGRTNSLANRLRGYPRGSRFVATFGWLVDCHDAERMLIRQFGTRFSVYRGMEYYKGNVEEMESLFREFCHKDPTPMLA